MDTTTRSSSWRFRRWIAIGACGLAAMVAAPLAALADNDPPPGSAALPFLPACADGAILGIAGACWRIYGLVDADTTLDIANRELEATLVFAAGVPIVTYDALSPLSRVVTRFETSATIGLSSVTVTDLGSLESRIELEGAVSDGAVDDVVAKHAFIRFAGVTAGFTTSIFDFSTGYAETDGLASSLEVGQIAWQGGADGLTLALALESAEGRSARETVWSERDSGLLPDFVARARLAMPGGTFQAMGALRDLDAREGNEAAALGWAMGGGIEWRLDTFRPGARWLATATVAEGGLTYTGADDFSTDFFVDDDVIRPTRSWSALTSILVPVGRTISLAGTASIQHTRTSGPTLDWRTQTTILSGTVNYVPVAGFLAGLDVTWLRDQAEARTLGVSAGTEAAERVVTRLFIKRAF